MWETVNFPHNYNSFKWYEWKSVKVSYIFVAKECRQIEKDCLRFIVNAPNYILPSFPILVFHSIYFIWFWLWLWICLFVCVCFIFHFPFVAIFCQYFNVFHGWIDNTCIVSRFVRHHMYGLRFKSINIQIMIVNVN